jgi:hypothetical protein
MSFGFVQDLSASFLWRWRHVFFISTLCLRYFSFQDLSNIKLEDKLLCFIVETVLVGFSSHLQILCAKLCLIFTQKTKIVEEKIQEKKNCLGGI